MANAIEYVVQVDTSKIKDGYYEGSATMRNAIASATTTGLVTIVQSKDIIFKEGDNSYIVFSPKRTRIMDQYFLSYMLKSFYLKNKHLL
jgi:hypothetical protein